MRLRGLELTDDQREVLPWGVDNFRTAYKTSYMLGVLRTYVIEDDRLRLHYYDRHDALVYLDKIRMAYESQRLGTN